MTLPDLPARRKPPSRWWLYGPYGVLVLAIILWSGAWIVIRGKVASRLQALAAATPNGPSLGWDRLKITGYPFRIEVVLDGVRASEPSGWGLAAGQVRAESYAYDLKHWVAYAPHGVVLDRPRVGPVTITGEALRASVALDAPGRTRVSIEGLKLAFAPSPGAQPFPVIAIEHFDAHTRPASGQDQTEFLVQMKDATLAPSSALARLAAGAPVSSAWHGTLSKASALAGRDWPDAARAWSAAGGVIDIAQGDYSTGAVKLEADGGRLTVGPDGRLRGDVGLALTGAPAALTALGQAGALPAGLGQQLAKSLQPQKAKLGLSFQGGAATFGPIAIGPAPRIY
jgi:hypothetical protein